MVARQRKKHLTSGLYQAARSPLVARSYGLSTLPDCVRGKTYAFGMSKLEEQVLS